MTPVSQWDASARPDAPRVRRSDRLVLGSFDGAAHVFQRQARTVILGSAVLMVPMMALNLLLSVVAFRDFDSFDSLFADRGFVGVESSTVFLAVLVQSFTAHLLGAYAAAFVMDHQMGGTPRMRVGLRSVVRKLPLLVLTWLLTHWWAVLVALLVVNAPVVAAGAVVIIAPVVAILSAFVVVVVPVVMGEGLGVRSIGRGLRLARARFGAAFGFVMLCSLLGGSLFVFIGQLPVLLESTGLVTFGSLGYLVQGVAVQLALLVVLPLIAVATAQFYLQLRVHVEGLDLVLAADRAFGTPA
jgi:hypothetical protein